VPKTLDFHVHNFLLAFLFPEANVLLNALGRRPSQSEKDFRKNDDMCPGVSKCAERFSDSHSGALITFYNLERFFDGLENYSVWKNGK
jgi:hypothetical protein